MITLDDALSVSDTRRETRRSFPNLQAARVMGLDRIDSLRDISCLQMTELGLWFSWDFPWRASEGTDGKSVPICFPHKVRPNHT